MNEYIAALVDELYRLGVRHAVFSPGGRSTAMAVLFQEHGGFTTFMNIDERSAGFMALGIGKAHRMPAVLVCTSGSAMTHYGPAVLEADYSGVPLIILSADRPPVLFQAGAPQTVDQHRWFGNSLRYFEELAVPREADRYTYPRQVARRAFMKALDIRQGPVHVNVPMFEPLMPDTDRRHFEAGRMNRDFSLCRGEVTSPDLSTVETLIKGKCVLILAGPDTDVQDGPSVIALADRLQAPVIADPLSNLRRFDSVHCISSYDAFLKDKQLRERLRPDCVIQLGQIPVSKRIQQFAGGLDCDYIEVTPTMNWINPMMNTTVHVQSRIRAFCDGLCAGLHAPVKADEYLTRWIEADGQSRRQLDRAAQEETCFEGRSMMELQRVMQEGQIVSANSMSIRDMDWFWAAGRSRACIYGNRGTNGIDGTVSTALGMATNGKPTVLVTGDLAFFHDMNGLAVAKTHGLNLTILLHNNDGGGIFEYLPQRGTKHFNYLFATEQGLGYAALHDLFGVNYTAVKSPDELPDLLRQAVMTPGIHIIEVPTDKALSRELHRRYTTVEVQL